ncbi:MAG: tRNA lysidine(34) synthetase TilS, partial [Ignavibacteriales bacterium]|nr:tRNA lysidine(34) synthetase TilS [Ignavibacteriales bacterium]
MSGNSATLKSRFEDFLTGNALVDRGNGVVVAVSGGVDSMVLLDLFRCIARTWRLTIAVAHINHQLRGAESDADEEFVRAIAGEAGLRFLSTRINIPEYQSAHGVSKQEAGRALRYQFLEHARLETGSQHVATAHHADDNAETVLMNALRGAGIRGLSGIPLRREPAIIRPLLFAYRSEIEAYAKERRIPYREDSSNTSRSYVRNILRHDVLPALGREFQTDAIRSLNRISALMRSLGELLVTETAKVSASVISQDGGQTALSVAALRALPVVLQEELVLSFLRLLEIEPTEQKVAAILGLCDQPSGRSIDLSAQYSILRDRQSLVVFHRETNEFQRDVQIGPDYDFPGFTFSVRPLPSVPDRFDHPPGMEYADADRLGRRLTLRSW